MAVHQVVTVLICQAINILDGFDVVLISYAGPLLAREWELPAVRLGTVFSASLVGMTVGAFVLAPLADYVGRRRTIIGGLSVVTAGMLLTYWVDSVPQIVATRILTGLGVGALFASLTTLVVEYSSERRRTLSVSLLYLGYPIGAVLGGLIAQFNIERTGWQAFFLYGGLITGALIPVALLRLPESLDYLLSRQPKRALSAANKLIRKLGYVPINALPPKPPAAGRQAVSVLFSEAYRRQTTALWVSFFASLLVIYFLISRTPQILASAGLALDQSILGGMLLNLGGGAGMLLVGLGKKNELDRPALRRAGASVVRGLDRIDKKTARFELDGAIPDGVADAKSAGRCLAEGIGIAMKRSGRARPIVLRFAGNNADFGRTLLDNYGVAYTQAADMADAVDKVTALVRQEAA